VFRKQGFGHFVNTGFYGRHYRPPEHGGLCRHEVAVRAISEGLRQEAGDKLRVTIISTGLRSTDFTESMTSPEMKAQIAIA